MASILSIILAGGAGVRLYPLTKSRTKPAVPVAGSYRLIDFVLNNFVNSDLLKIYILTQFKSQSLNIHLRQAWYLSALTDHFIDPVPAQMLTGKRWYEGTADAIFQNLRLIKNHDPDLVCVFGSDHIYKMDVRQMIDFHLHKKADVSISSIPILKKNSFEFGVLEKNKNSRVINFIEKPKFLKQNSKDETILASMGNYIFNTDFLYEILKEDGKDQNSTHDFGHDILPKIYKKHKVYAYDFSKNKIKGEKNIAPYWQDVGNLDTFWQAHMDMLGTNAKFSLHNKKWPFRSYHPPLPPVHYLDSLGQSKSKITNASISAGSLLQDAYIDKSFLGFNVNVRPSACIKNSVIMGDCYIGEGAQIINCIIDKDSYIAPNTKLDKNNLHKDIKVTPKGICVAPKGTKIG